ncbi:AraC family transcriptional regulator [Streptomyces sp. NPDC019531]|uniref:AraC family transcriptional regulator n=1 Tax=Streptomyces sp. NPDC019531 TaxID=3365062 RepID=UPI00384CD556
MAKIFCPHRLSIVQRGSRLDARHHAAQAGGISLHYMDYGVPVHIAAGEVGDIFLVEIPLGDASEVMFGKHCLVADRNTAVVLSPNEPIELRRSAGSPQLIVRMERDMVESHLSRVLNRNPHRPLRFSVAMDLTSPGGRTWLTLVNLLRGEMENDGAILGEPLALAHFQNLLLTHLLLSQPNTHSDALHGRELPPPPSTVRRALEIIEARAGEPLTVTELAAEVHVSVRVLQEGFRRHLGLSPTEQLRQVRLERARRCLSEADPATTTVTSVAVRWGFLHLGRFAVEYRKQFGESPSATLRGGCADGSAWPVMPTSGRTGGSTPR